MYVIGDEMSMLIQVRVPVELVKRMDRLIANGLYRSRSEMLIDAVRHLLLTYGGEKPEVERFILHYLKGRVRREEDLEVIVKLFTDDVVERIMEKTEAKTPEELMRRIRR